MKTDELVTMLARGAEAVAPHEPERRYGRALAGGALAAGVLMALTLGVRPDLAAAAHDPMFWIKLAFPASVLAVALLATIRLSQPGSRLGALPATLAAAVASIWLLAAVQVARAPAVERVNLLLGETWLECPLNVALLSLPVFVAVLWTSHGMAPTRPALAGAAAGLAAGAAGALVYAVHCTEMAAPFIGIWYLLGMLIPSLAAAILGPRLLRW